MAHKKGFSLLDQLFLVVVRMSIPVFSFSGAINVFSYQHELFSSQPNSGGNYASEEVL